MAPPFSFDSRTPTNYELANCPHVVLSSSNEWNPRDVQFPQHAHHLEEGRNINRIRAQEPEEDAHFDMSTCNFDACAMSCIISDRLIAEVRIQGDEIPLDVPLPKKSQQAIATLESLRKNLVNDG